MTDAQMLQNLLIIEDTMVIHRMKGSLPVLKEVISELRRRIILEESK